MSDYKWKRSAIENLQAHAKWNDVFIPLIVVEWKGIGVTADPRIIGFIPVYQSLPDLLEAHGPDCKYLTFNKHEGKVEQ